MPWAVSCWPSWLNSVRSSSSLISPGIGWVAGRPSSSTNSIGTCGICIAWAIAGEASMSMRPARNRPSYSLATVATSRAIVALSGAWPVE